MASKSVTGLFPWGGGRTRRALVGGLGLVAFTGAAVLAVGVAADPAGAAAGLAEFSDGFNWQRPSGLAALDEYQEPVSEPTFVNRADGEEARRLADGDPREDLRRDHLLYCIDGSAAEGYRAWRDSDLALLAQMLRFRPPTIDEEEGITAVCLISTTPSIQPLQITFDEDSGRRVYVFADDAFQSAHRQRVRRLDVAGDGTYFSGTLRRAVLGAFFADAEKLGEILREECGYGADVREGGLHRPLNQEELLVLLGVLMDLPPGLRPAPGLLSFVRRRDGSRNPQLPNAPAVSYVAEGYIELTDGAFEGPLSSTERVLVHEIAHFVYTNRLDEYAREEWRDLGGWTRTGERDWWHHRTSTSFVSSYAAFLNPEEDFAESVAAYVTNPERARSVAADKYRFVSRYMGGYEYLTQVRDSYTFRVYSSFHKDSAPGYIESIELRSWKVPDANPDRARNNLVEIEIRLADWELRGERCFIRILSPSANQFVDVWLYAEGEKLRGQVIIDGHAEAGSWTPKVLRIEDDFGNVRHQDVATIDWELWIDNPHQDLDAPRPLWRNGNARRTRRGADTEITVHLPIDEASPDGARACVTMASQNGQVISSWGGYSPEHRAIRVQLVLHDYHDSGAWGFRGVTLHDRAGNGRYYEAPDWMPAIDVVTDRPDRRGPELDVDGVFVVSSPGEKAGETKVEIDYSLRDDISGFTMAYVVLESPSGRRVGQWQYESDRSEPYPSGDVRSWQDRVAQFILPDGTEPGLWTLQEIVAHDRAGNETTQRFVTRGVLVAQ